jgi:hypothetical protein
MDYRIAELYVYPIKALGGIGLQQATLSDIGIQYDRYWMLTDAKGQFITQRDLSWLCAFEVSFVQGGIRVQYKGSAVEIAFASQSSGERVESAVWDTPVVGIAEEAAVNKWFSEQLGFEAKLIRASEGMRFDSRRPDVRVGFADACQYLFVGESALAYLNARLNAPIGADRFRPNVVFSGGTPHEEDEWASLSAGSLHFDAVKSCARCQVITIDQQTGIAGKEPLKTLAQYRTKDNKVYFGRYFALKGKEGVLSVGDVLLPMSST